MTIENVIVPAIVSVLLVIGIRYLEQHISKRVPPVVIPSTLDERIYFDSVIAQMRKERDEDIDAINREAGRLIQESKQACQEQMEAMQAEYQRVQAAMQIKIDFLVEQLIAAGGKVPPQISAPVGAVKKKSIVVLGLWPVSDLLVRPEIDAIFRSGIEYVAIKGRVTKATVLAEVERLQPGIVHVGAHASVDGVELDDGFALVGWWAGLAKTFALGLVVLNACESLEIVDAMQDAGVGAVVGMRGEIKDEVAVQFTREFYSRLMRGLSVAEAARRARMTLGHMDAEMITARDPNSWRIQ